MQNKFTGFIDARLFGAVLDKVEVTVYTEKDDMEKWLEKARKAYDYRNKDRAMVAAPAIGNKRYRREVSPS